MLQSYYFFIRWDNPFFLNQELHYNYTHHSFSAIHSVITSSSLQCIASTTIDEYRLYFEKDTALARRFQPVWVDEPSEVVLHIYMSISLYAHNLIIV